MQERVKELKKEQDQLEEYIKDNKRQRASLTPQRIKTRMPRVGDHVVAMWGMSQWQYFTATVVDYDPVEMLEFHCWLQTNNILFREYTIDWDDNDPTGRTVNFQNIALDVQPDQQSINIGTIVLFKQGKMAEYWLI